MVRKQRQLTQLEVAERLNVSRNTIQNLEAGKNFTADTLLKGFDLLADLYREVMRLQRDIEETKSLH